MVRYRIDHSGFVNTVFAPVEADVRREVRARVGWRNVPAVSFVADEGLGYGEVLSVLSDLKKDDPDLFVVLLTTSQAGTVDGTDRLHTLCLS